MVLASTRAYFLRRKDRRPTDANPDMNAQATARPAITHSDRLAQPGYQAFLLLRVVFTVAPILFGLDKFAGVLVDWDQYLAPWINDIVPGSASDAMYAVGVIEIAAGVIVAFVPRYGAPLVAAWLGGIIFNLLTYSGYYDIALRDFGLLVGALALWRLSVEHAD
jgi:hypothetical protein